MRRLMRRTPYRVSSAVQRSAVQCRCWGVWESVGRCLASGFGLGETSGETSGVTSSEQRRRNPGGGRMDFASGGRVDKPDNRPGPGACARQRLRRLEPAASALNGQRPQGRCAEPDCRARGSHRREPGSGGMALLAGSRSGIRPLCPASECRHSARPAREHQSTSWLRCRSKPRQTAPNAPNAPSCSPAARPYGVLQRVRSCRALPAACAAVAVGVEQAPRAAAAAAAAAAASAASAASALLHFATTRPSEICRRHGLLWS